MLGSGAFCHGCSPSVGYPLKRGLFLKGVVLSQKGDRHSFARATNTKYLVNIKNTGL
jgi:hypothetical protein